MLILYVEQREKINRCYWCYVKKGIARKYRSRGENVFVVFSRDLRKQQWPWRYLLIKDDPGTGYRSWLFAYRTTRARATLLLSKNVSFRQISRPPIAPHRSTAYIQWHIRYFGNFWYRPFSLYLGESRDSISSVSIHDGNWNLHRPPHTLPFLSLSLIIYSLSLSLIVIAPDK